MYRKKSQRYYFPLIFTVFLQSNLLVKDWLSISDVIVVQKNPVEKESSLSMGGTIIFIAPFPPNYILGQQYDMSRSCNSDSSEKSAQK